MARDPGPEAPVHGKGAIRPFAVCGSFTAAGRHVRDWELVTCPACLSRRPWVPERIPQELIDILDLRAGRQHSRTGSVVSCLAEILTAYDRLRARSGG